MTWVLGRKFSLRKMVTNPFWGKSMTLKFRFGKKFSTAWGKNQFGKKFSLMRNSVQIGILFKIKIQFSVKYCL